MPRLLLAAFIGWAGLNAMGQPVNDNFANAIVLIGPAGPAELSGALAEAAKGPKGPRILAFEPPGGSLP